MQGGEPFFTILIPTKGRVHHARFALESLRTQTFEDFEVILLDSDPSSDTARAYFGGWQGWLDARFRYVRTGDVWMSENIESGLAHARGRYLHVCQDKAVMAQDALALVHDRLAGGDCRSLVFELVSHLWDAGNHSFTHDRPGLQELQLQPHFGYGTGIQQVDCERLASAQVLEEFLVHGWETICFRAPRAFNCFTELQCIRDIHAQGVPFFDVTSPDLCSALRLLDHLPDFHITKAPLASHFHSTTVSFGTTWRYRFDYAVDAFSRLPPGVLAHLHAMPLGLTPLFHNGIFGDYVKLRGNAQGLLRGSRLRSDNYFAKVLHDVDNLHEPDERRNMLRDIVQRRRAEFAPEYI